MIYLYLLVSYVVGTIMTGYVVTRVMKGKDIRTMGSGNVGARNAGRLLGKKGFFITAIGDGLKGLFVVLGAKYFGFTFEIQILSLIAVVIGHIWPITLRFKGGKGIATAVGGLLALSYQPFLIFVGIVLILFLILRSITFAGMIGFFTVPFIYWLFDYSYPQCLLILIVVALLIFAHRDNLKEKLSKRS
ncbi:glycerol-3-phosphate 1-O-acyltransferase PlsY [Fredinandcohnia quinoae]|uniref:Glycerol-3-phosphate acyltransferase n=1 Tax=Fredinandcohnia quinoae TaxID=2918902 RepID=A0AAW5E8H4_9BACI|nr:glycerol-3-phosphate 1-O-acyltransferase PlsY [Fredinandcohnia sp. SECRCQ15]